LIELIDDILSSKEMPVKQYEPTTFEVLPITNTVRVELGLIEHIFTSLGEVLVQKNTITDRERELLNIVEEISQSSRRLLKEIADFSDRYWLAQQDSGQKITDIFFTDLVT